MGSSLELFGMPERGRRRGSALERQREKVASQTEVDVYKLLGDGKKEEVKAMMRKRLAEAGMEDVTDVANLARELAGQDA
ncbi:hypothetical protein ACWD5V_36500 [Streptomyces sp. NPDC002523]